MYALKSIALIAQLIVIVMKFMFMLPPKRKPMLVSVHED